MKRITLSLLVALMFATQCFSQEATSKIVLLRPYDFGAAMGAVYGGKKYYAFDHFIDIDGQFFGNLASMTYYEIMVVPGTHTIIGYVGQQGPDAARSEGQKYSLALNTEANKTYYVCIAEKKMTISLINEKQWNKEIGKAYPVKWISKVTLKDEVFYDANGKAIASTTRPEVVNQAQQQVIVQQVGGTTAPQISGITITTPFAEVSASSVLAIYKNEFGKYEMPEKDETFPYVAIRVKLQGAPNLIRLAKQNLTLNLGQMFQTEQTVTSYDNMILFLIPAGAKNIYLTCGDGCERQLIYSGSLQANRIYDGVVSVK